MAKKSTGTKTSPTKSLSQLKNEICDIGRRIYNKGFAAGNDGNISYRLGPDRVLCTPTMMSKGFMTPADLCIVDMEGNQIAGKRKRSSEILLHLTIMKERPDVKSVVHCHPPHATAFAVAREPIPQSVLPEVEVFLGDIPISRYETPGNQTFADTVRPLVARSNVILLANHGTVSFGETVERAYWWTEIVDAYCRILMLAKGLGNVTYLTGEETRALLDLKQKWGFTDARVDMGLDDRAICDNAVFRDTWAEVGVARRAFATHPEVATGGRGSTGRQQPTAIDVEKIVRTITEQVCREFGITGR
ncbi:MAG: L-ribulose-5-phosphate 4-epimerase UlaF [Planctomycetota bacterium]|jgi:L-fuculose-phosphate aldolase